MAALERDTLLARAKEDRDQYARLIADLEGGTFHLMRMDGAKFVNETPAHLELLRRILKDVDRDIAGLEAEDA